MNAKRIKEIQKDTGYPNSVSVQQALLKVWNECEQERQLYSAGEDPKEPIMSHSGEELKQLRSDFLSMYVLTNDVDNASQILDTLLEKYVEYAQSQLPKEGEEVKESVQDWNEWEKEAEEWFAIEIGSIVTMKAAYISGYKMGCSNQFTRMLKKLTRPTVSEEEIRKVMANYWDMNHPEVPDFIAEFKELLTKTKEG